MGETGPLAWRWADRATDQADDAEQQLADAQALRAVLQKHGVT